MCGTRGSLRQGASRAAPGKSGLHARGEGERVLALESREGTRASRRGRGLGPRDALKKDSRGLSRGASGLGVKPDFMLMGVIHCGPLSSFRVGTGYDRKTKHVTFSSDTSLTSQPP